MMRIGFGYDIHALVTGRPLLLGGIRIPFKKGLSGHSDADVLCHAVSDALLGAAALGDIGLLFPDTDPHYKDANSLKLLEQVIQKVYDAGYRISNVDTTIITEMPKIQPYREAITQSLSGIMGLSQNQVSVKAKTHEKFDATGHGQAIEVYAVVMLED
jgi:2-C-methyl-D-erythritol 2,4-cyclodiphosphate synthase